MNQLNLRLAIWTKQDLPWTRTQKSQKQSLSHAIKAVLNDVKEFDVKFKHPYKQICTGPSQSGKSCFVKTLLHKRQIEPFPSKVILAYKEWQPLYDEMREQALVQVFVPGLEDVMNHVDGITPSLLILDDLQHEVAKMILSALCS